MLKNLKNNNEGFVITGTIMCLIIFIVGIIVMAIMVFILIQNIIPLAIGFLIICVGAVLIKRFILVDKKEGDK
jgi:hypothetical protein